MLRVSSSQSLPPSILVNCASSAAQSFPPLDDPARTAHQTLGRLLNGLGSTRLNRLNLRGSCLERIVLATLESIFAGFVTGPQNRTTFLEIFLTVHGGAKSTAIRTPLRQTLPRQDIEKSRHATSSCLGISFPLLVLYRSI